jgi:hypothetical protein
MSPLATLGVALLETEVALPVVPEIVGDADLSSVRLLIHQL